MKKATNVLLLLSIIFGFILFVVFLIFAIVFCLNAVASVEQIKEAIIKSGYVGTITDEMIAAYRITAWACFVGFLITSVCSLVVAILSIGTRTKLKIGGLPKNKFIANGVLLIVFGVLSFELPIIPGIFLLAMDKKLYEGEPAPVEANVAK